MEGTKFPFQKSASGGSGQTFLPLSRTIPWVIKWQPIYQAECEVLCSKFYKRTFTHLSVPQVEFVSEETLKKLQQFFSQRPSTNIPKDYHPILIEYKVGQNLKKACETNNIFSLSSKAWLTLFENLGEIAGYDLLIGNCDRFIPENIHSTKQAISRVNSGNILIEWNNDKALKTVHLIDNAPHFSSFFDVKEKRSRSSSSSSIGASNLFNNSQDSSNESSQDQSPVQNQIVLSGEQKRKNRLADLKYFTSAPKEGIQKIAKLIYKDIASEFTQQISQPDKLINSLEKGLTKAQLKMKKTKFMDELEAVKKEKSDWSPQATLLLNFMEEAINHLQEIQTTSIK
ncbi:hypothetical protein [Candidatus Neptunochlamydia vexilliferae]|uniref:Uncharacterized protein n=1 Tax=Candidatus Neptunichlamydia vexilliferae TaxID=1651774 RepID=A0ABS0B0A8_9BACT|nr:hypothetical protein [Candidatus Neptunochlamydia vexilliferae]MBF5059806.1 hypothetical protein [Candidatus Neptunochlamydia vexilliferae]